MGIVTVPLRNRNNPSLCAVVDAEDAQKVEGYRWYATQDHSGDFYAYLMGGTSMHRLLMDAGPSEYVDHINGDKLDNRRSENLRKCSNSDNLCNRGVQKNNTSGFKGVTKQVYGKWNAAIMRHGKKYPLGDFDTPEEAAKAYDTAARELHGEYAFLNFPNSDEYVAPHIVTIGQRNRSGYRGVYWSSRTRKWIAQIAPGTKKIYLGGFDLSEDAARRYDHEAKRIFGDRARLNFPVPIQQILTMEERVDISQWDNS